LYFIWQNISEQEAKLSLRQLDRIASQQTI